MLQVRVMEEEVDDMEGTGGKMISRGLAEWLNAAVSKTVILFIEYRRFESFILCIGFIF